MLLKVFRSLGPLDPLVPLRTFRVLRSLGIMAGQLLLYPGGGLSGYNKASGYSPYKAKGPFKCFIRLPEALLSPDSPLLTLSTLGVAQPFGTPAACYS